MASFVHNNWKGHFGISVSELCFKNGLGLLINNRSNFREERIIVRKVTATFREEQIIANYQDESSSKAVYHSKNRADQNNRCHESAGKFRRNIVSSEISLKSHEKWGISSKFVCITFAQYCNYDEAYSFIKPYLVKSLCFHACPRDCVLFRDTDNYKYSTLVKCPKCGSDRFLSRNIARSILFICHWGHVSVASMGQRH